MSIQSLRTGVSGLNANQTRLDTISNNISNSGTVAFKKGRVAFSEVLGQEVLGVGRSSGGTNINPSQVGRGVSIGSVDKNFSQGSLDQTGIKTDLALSGDGFFVASPKEGSGSQQRRLTRAGNFTFNQNGEFVTANGLNVQGWKVDNEGNVNTGELENIQFDPNAQSSAKFTSAAEIGGNLSADAEVDDTSSISSTVFDEQGTAHDIVVEYTKQGQNTWDYEIKNVGIEGAGDDALSFPTGNGSVKAYTDGSGKFLTDSENNILTTESSDLDTSNPGVSTTPVTEGFLNEEDKLIAEDDNNNGDIDTGEEITKAKNLPDGVSATTVESKNGSIKFAEDGSVEKILDNSGSEIDEPSISWKDEFVDSGSLSLNMNGLTQFSGSTTSKFQSQNGNSAGELTDFSITPEGELQLNFTNGEQEKIFQLAIGDVNNPNGLKQQGENFFTTTSASGDVQLGRAGRDLRTSVVSGSLESSNVDLADEFADLIEAQRSYQASSRVVTTADQVLQETVGLKR
jgi:flagellar hook protein FlgE